MADEGYEHLFLSEFPKAHSYTPPKSRGPESKNRGRVRSQHGLHLRGEIYQALDDARRRRADYDQEGLPEGLGITLEFESDTNVPLVLESLENKVAGVELLNVRPSAANLVASVFIPDKSREFFLKRVDEYLAKQSPKGEPKHKPLIDPIDSIRLSVVESLWTDSQARWPAECEQIAWEVWLRVGKDRETIYDAFLKYAEAKDVNVPGKRPLDFVDRRVVLAYATREEMSRVIDLGVVAELRRAYFPQTHYEDLSNEEQNELVEDLLDRLQEPSEDAPAVCILDTGVARGHPLIKPALSEEHMFAYDADEWGVVDSEGHGTGMAGLALYGDLSQALESGEQVILEHRLESAKILPPPPEENAEELFGAITADAVSQAEIASPDRQRAVCMAVTFQPSDDGRPTTWSAEVDQLCSGFLPTTQTLEELEPTDPRLFCVSAGNIRKSEKLSDYPDSNEKETVEDPAHAWNPVTVGAFTERIMLEDSSFANHNPLASSGDLAPSSRTSRVWEDSDESWPLKPDIVMEGGNYAVAPDGTVSPADDLALLSTNNELTKALFQPFSDTSAATAQAARLAAILQARYPDSWPETIRALLVHSARWTPQMLARYDAEHRRHKRDLRRLIRCCGFGVPDLERASFSASDRLTLIAEDSIQPFSKESGKSNITLNEMKKYDLPWPTGELLGIGPETVRLRVTLSYFIEPNPGERGRKARYSYASHGLRFEVKDRNESDENFFKRINAKVREKGYESPSRPNSRWRLSSDLRHLGSIHSDIWEGRAADLATMDSVAVYPVKGWWAHHTRHKFWKRKARYSLVVSIESPGVDVDIYTPVSVKLGIPVTT